MHDVHGPLTPAISTNEQTNDRMQITMSRERRISSTNEIRELADECRAERHNLISVQRPRSTRSSSVVTLARPPTSSSLKITDRPFRYVSPCLRNQLPLSPRQPHSGTSSSISDSAIFSPVTSSFSDSLHCSSITPSNV